MRNRVISHVVGYTGVSYSLCPCGLTVFAEINYKYSLVAVDWEPWHFEIGTSLEVAAIMYFRHKQTIIK